MTAKIDKIIRLEAPTQQASNRDRSLSLQGFRKLKGENQVQLEQFLKNLSPCLLQYKFAVYDDKGSIFIEARQEIQNSSFKNDSPEIFARMSDIFEVLMDYQEKIFRKCNLDNFFVNNREILMQEIFDLLLKILHEKSSKVGQYIEENYKFTNKCEFEAFKKRFEKSLQEKNQKAICDYVDIYNSFQENYQTIYYCPSLVSLHRSKLNDMVRGYILDQIYLTHMKNGINSSIVYEELKKDFKKYFLEDAGSDLFEPETYDGPDNLSILFHIILLTDYHKDNGNDPILNIATIKQFYKIFIHQWTEIYPALKESYGLAMSAHQDSLVQQQMAKCLESFKERWSNNVKRPNLIAMMALFIGFHFVSSESKMNKSYDPHCRAMLMSVFRNLKDGENIFSNDQILCCMESLIMEYSELIDQPRVNMNSSVSLVLKNVRNTVVKNVTEKLVHQKQVECLQYKIPNEIIKPKTFFFEKISSLSNNSRAIFIVVSGFTSELDINSDEWKVLPGLFPNSEVIALNWKSNSIKQMVEKIGGDAIKDALPFASIGILFVWMRFVTSGINKVKEEWNLTYQQAITTGVYLAHFLAKTNILKGHILNLVGFSLGTLVVMSCVWELERIQRYDIVYDVLLMGGVVNIDDFYKHSLKSVNNRLINCYSRTDMILSMMLKSANPEVSPIGLGPILWPNKKVRNVDVTHVADGHSKYRPALREVIVRTGFNEELHPLFKTYSNGVF